MKYNLSLLAAAGLVLVGSTGVRAQDNALKLDIFQPIINTLSVSFEHKLSETSSFQLNLAGTFGYQEDGDYFFTNYDERKTSGFSISPEYRFYLSEKYPALQGFYVAPFIRYQYLNQTGIYTTFRGAGQKSEASLNAFGLGALVGRHWIFKQRFSLDLFLGPAYTLTTVSSDEPKVSKGDFVGYINNNNYDIRGGLTFGIAI